MNFDDAISAHIKWKIRLNQYIDGFEKGTLGSDLVCRDNVCELGQWIYGEGGKFQAFAGYREMVKAHANFHVQAGAVVKKFEEGDAVGAKAAMGGSFAIASKETVTAILKLKREVLCI